MTFLAAIFYSAAFVWIAFYNVLCLSEDFLGGTAISIRYGPGAMLLACRGELKNTVDKQRCELSCMPVFVVLPVSIPELVGDDLHDINGLQ